MEFKKIRKVTSRIFLTLALLSQQLVPGMGIGTSIDNFASAAIKKYQVMNGYNTELTSNAGTYNIASFFGDSNEPSVYNDGRIFVDKSVSLDKMKLGEEVLTDKPLDGNFNVMLSALAQSYKTTGNATTPADVVFVLDTSGSMDEYEGGYTIKNTKIYKAVEALNSAIDSVLAANKDSRIGVVVYSGCIITAAWDYSEYKPDTLEILPLSRYTKVDGTTDANSYLKVEYNGNLLVTQSPGLKDGKGNEYKKSSGGYYGTTGNCVEWLVAGGTFTQAGIANGCNVLTKSDNELASGVKRTPAIVLITDGEPGYYRPYIDDFDKLVNDVNGRIYGEGNPTDLTSIGRNNVGTATIATAIKAKDLIKTKYGADSTPLFYTVGFGVSAGGWGEALLNPQYNNNTDYGNLKSSNLSGWDYTGLWSGVNNQGRGHAGSSLIGWGLAQNENTLNYADKAFINVDATGLSDALHEITGDINNVTLAPMTPITATQNGDTPQELTFTDVIGDGMAFKGVASVMFDSVIFGGNDWLGTTKEEEVSGDSTEIVTKDTYYYAAPENDTEGVFAGDGAQSLPVKDSSWERNGAEGATEYGYTVTVTKTADLETYDSTSKFAFNVPIHAGLTGEERNLNELDIKFVTEKETTTLTYKIPEKLIPIFDFADGGKYNENQPIRLMYGVGLSDPNSVREGVSFYANEIDANSDGCKCTAVYTPADSNPYYQKDMLLDPNGNVYIYSGGAGGRDEGLYSYLTDDEKGNLEAGWTNANVINILTNKRKDGATKWFLSEGYASESMDKNDSASTVTSSDTERDFTGTKEYYYTASMGTDGKVTALLGNNGKIKGGEALSSGEVTIPVGKTVNVSGTMPSEMTSETFEIKCAKGISKPNDEYGIGDDVAGASATIEITNLSNGATGDANITIPSTELEGAGPWYFAIYENAGSGTNWKHDSTIYFVKVEVASEGTVNAATGAETASRTLKWSSRKNGESGWSEASDDTRLGFTNTLTGDVHVEVKKTLENVTWEALRGEEDFTFELYTCDDEGAKQQQVKVDGNPVTVNITNETAAEFTIPEAALPTEGNTLYFAVKEKAKTAWEQVGPETYYLQVTKASDGMVTLKYRKSFEGGTDWTDMPNEPLVFTNRPKNTVNDALPTGMKYLDGQESGIQFDFTVTRLDPSGGVTDGEEYAFSNVIHNETGAGDSTKGRLDLSSAGFALGGNEEYYFEIKENANKEYITDPEVYYVGVKWLEDKGWTAYMLERDNGEFTWGKSPAGEDDIKFYNYTHNSVTVRLDALFKKELEGRAIKANEFEFTLNEEIAGNAIDDNAENLSKKETVRNLEDGSIPFNALTYNLEDLFTLEELKEATATENASKSKEFNYLVKETKGDELNMEYDDNEYVIGVSVGYSSGRMTAKIEYHKKNEDGWERIPLNVGGNITFSNKYTPVTITVRKTLKMLEEDKKDINKTFTFELYTCNAEGKEQQPVLVDGNPVTVDITNEGKANITIPANNLQENGPWYFAVKEQMPIAHTDFWNYDTTTYYVKVENKDGKAKLSYTRTVPHTGVSWTDMTGDLEFINALDPIEIPVAKVLNGVTWDKVNGAGFEIAALEVVLSNVDSSYSVIKNGSVNITNSSLGDSSSTMRKDFIKILKDVPNGGSVYYVVYESGKDENAPPAGRSWELDPYGYLVEVTNNDGELKLDYIKLTVLEAASLVSGSMEPETLKGIIQGNRWEDLDSDNMPTFTNALVHTVKPLNIIGTKYVDEEICTDKGAFEFTVTMVDAAGLTLNTDGKGITDETKNKEPLYQQKLYNDSYGKINFGDLQFTLANTDNVQLYKIEETAMPTGENYLPNQEVVYVGIKYNETANLWEAYKLSGLSLPPAKWGESQLLIKSGDLDFHNYTFKEVSFDPSTYVKKILKNQTLENGMFEFKIEQVGSDFETLEGGYTQTVSIFDNTVTETVDGETISSGNVAFAPIAYSLDSLRDSLGGISTKTFFYKITETAGTDKYDYSNKVYVVFVDVTYTDKDVFVVKVTQVLDMTNADSENWDYLEEPYEMVFENTYTGGSTIVDEPTPTPEPEPTPVTEEPVTVTEPAKEPESTVTEPDSRTGDSVLPVTFISIGLLSALAITVILIAKKKKRGV